MRGLQNIKLNKGWLCNTFDTCERRGQIQQPQSTELIFIYIVSGFTCNNNNNNNNNNGLLTDPLGGSSLLKYINYN